MATIPDDHYLQNPWYRGRNPRIPRDIPQRQLPVIYQERITAAEYEELDTYSCEMQPSLQIEKMLPNGRAIVDLSDVVRLEYTGEYDGDIYRELVPRDEAEHYVRCYITEWDEHPIVIREYSDVFAEMQREAE